MAQQTRLSTNNTTITNDEGWTCVTLHRTCIVRFNDDEIILDNGGWNTATTATRMNQASSQFRLGFHVSRKGGRMTANGIQFIGDRMLSLTRKDQVAA